MLSSLADRVAVVTGASSGIGPTWTTTLHEWQWVMGVNLMGVVHGVRAFVPRMLEQGGPAHVVNTSSAAGLVVSAGSSVYCASKHAVVALSECLHQELRAQQAQIGVSVLCPAYVRTGIVDSGRNRPASLGESNPLAQGYEERLKEAVTAGRLTAKVPGRRLTPSRPARSTSCRIRRSRRPLKCG